MLLQLVRNTEWEMFVDLLSPAIFDAVSPGAITEETTELVGNYFRKEKFESIKKEREEFLDDSGVDVHIVSKAMLQDANRIIDAKLHGESVLRLYFHQLFVGSHTLLDLRTEAFAAHTNKLLWAPSPMYIQWDADFLQAIRKIYEGFYHSDGGTYFEGVHELKLEPVHEIFRESFGTGLQSQVRFSVSHFQDCFHRLFTECRIKGVRLHANFLPFGLYLVSMYEHLESLNSHFDVHSAFESAEGID